MHTSSAIDEPAGKLRPEMSHCCRHCAGLFQYRGCLQPMMGFSQRLDACCSIAIRKAIRVQYHSPTKPSNVRTGGAWGASSTKPRALSMSIHVPWSLKLTRAPINIRWINLSRCMPLKGQLIGGTVRRSLGAMSHRVIGSCLYWGYHKATCVAAPAFVSRHILA